MSPNMQHIIYFCIYKPKKILVKKAGNRKDPSQRSAQSPIEQNSANSDYLGKSCAEAECLGLVWPNGVLDKTQFRKAFFVCEKKIT